MPQQTTIQTKSPVDDSEQALRSSIERIVCQHFHGGTSSIESIERKRSEFSSFYASDIITVRLVSGEQFKIFLKDFGSFDHPKDTMK